MAWTTEGKKSSPSNGTLLADTGQKDAGTYTFKFLATAAVTVGTLNVEQRNSGNSTTLMSQIIDAPIGQTIAFDLGPITLGQDERIRVITSGTILGDVQASLFYQ